LRRALLSADKWAGVNEVKQWKARKYVEAAFISLQTKNNPGDTNGGSGRFTSEVGEEPIVV